MKCRLTIAAVFALASSSMGVDLAFSTYPGPQEPAGENPVIGLQVDEAANILVLVRRSGPAGYVNRVNLNVRAESQDGGAVAAVMSVSNPWNGVEPRGRPENYPWDVYGVFGEFGENGLLVNNADAYASFYRPGASVDADFQLFAIMRLVGEANGTVHLYLQTGEAGISESGGITTNRFGFGDEPVPNLPGVESRLPDLTVMVGGVPIPEPSALVLAIPACLVARRRQ